MEIKKVIRSKRKSISLQITEDATLIVRAPFMVSEETIDRVILKHNDWIEKKIREIKSRGIKYNKNEFIDKGSFLYLGDYYRLQLVKDQDIPLYFEEGFYLSKKYLIKAKEVFMEWYKERAYEKITQRVKWYAVPRTVSLTSP